MTKIVNVFAYVSDMQSEPENVGRRNHNGYGFNVHAREFELKKNAHTHFVTDEKAIYLDSVRKIACRPGNTDSFCFLVVDGTRKRDLTGKRVSATNKRWKNHERP